eukprot:gb/GFBE01057639.1/.p1 GENE.gb/GFBE01057639.1/~~gb/GFBE01057639.1/.p1  ORF type:complete len:270 (+),score=54.95 gb/GFBE01057639.1/:1-810(+)
MLRGMGKAPCQQTSSLGPCRRRKGGAAVCAFLAAALVATSGWSDCWVAGGAPRSSSTDLRKADSPCVTKGGSLQLESPDAGSPDLAPNRRGLGGVAALGALLLGGFASAPPTAAEPPNVLEPIPPKPNKNPVIRKYQELSWKLEPYDRMRLYLQAVSQRFIATLETSIFNSLFYIHWAPGLDSVPNVYKFDIMDRSNYNEAVKQGKILIDSDLTFAEDGIEVYVYKDEEARDYCQKNLVIKDLVVIPKDLQDAIEIIKSTPFPEYKPEE